VTLRAALLTVLWVWPLAADATPQMPRDQPRAMSAAAGRIAGRVVSAGADSRPLRRARVTLNGSALLSGRTAITSDEGTFVFDALPAGQYSIGVVKSGYISTAYGATGPGRAGLPITVSVGGEQTITVIVPRGSVITGMLADAGGQPLPGLRVRALTYRIMPPGGERRLIEVPGSAVVSDDRGVYRIFGLPAAEYAVSVQPGPGAEAYTAGLRTASGAEIRQALAEVRQSRDRRGSPVSSPRPSAAAEAQGRMTFAPVFHPGTSSASEARLLSLGPGEERTGADIEIGYVPVARIGGSVIGGGGGASAAYVRLVPDPADTLADSAAFRGTITDAAGAFGFDNLPPGRYTVTARSSSDGGTPLRYDPATSLWASTEVVLDGQDIPDIVLTPVPGLTIEGRIVFTGQRPPPSLAGFGGMGLPLSSRGMPGSQPAVALTSPDGRLRIPSVPPGLYGADFTLGIRKPIGAWWLKSVAIDGREALDAPLELRSSLEGVTVTFADTASELRGRVASSAGQAAANCLVVVFPAERASWFFNSRRIASIPLDAQGRYVVRNLPAGDYLIVARNDLDTFEWFNPLTLEKLAPSAAKVTIRNDDPVTFDITVR
jgi:uncharacterized protein (DUF2141 family)